MCFIFLSPRWQVLLHSMISEENMVLSAALNTNVPVEYTMEGLTSI